MKILILDDDLPRHDQFKQSLKSHSLQHVYTVNECIHYLETERFDIVFLDHDLGGMVYQPPGPDTGFAVAVWLRDNPEKNPEKVFVHSLNEGARALMVNYIPGAQELPFAWIKERRIVNSRDIINT